MFIHSGRSERVENMESVLRRKLTTKACKNDLLHCLKTYLFAAFSSWLSLLFDFSLDFFRFVVSILYGNTPFYAILPRYRRQ